MVQYAAANRIEEKWIAAGSPYCDHPSIDKEYFLSADSGDKRCLSCGDTFTRPDWKSGNLEPRGNLPAGSTPAGPVDLDTPPAEAPPIGA